MQKVVYLFYSLSTTFQVNIEPVTQEIRSGTVLKKDPTGGPNHLQSKSIWYFPPEV